MLKIEWLGHSSFKLSYNNYQIVIDPYGDNVISGLSGVHESAHSVYCSHEHKDHNARENVNVLPFMDNPFNVSVIDSYHDDSQGSSRGKNKILILENKDMKIVHLGDIGCIPSDDEIDKLLNISVLFVPIGGHYTLNLEDTVGLVKRLNPKVLVPMHYRSDHFGPKVIGTLSEFLNLMDKEVVDYHSSSFDYDETIKSCIVVLQPKNVL